MDNILIRANDLYQELSDFILEADGDVAVYLEEFSSLHLSRLSKSQYQGNQDNQMVLSMFASESRIKNKTPIELFIENQNNLSTTDINLLINWQKSFVGLFSVKENSPTGLHLTNTMTDKDYHIKIKNSHEQQQLSRVKPGEILLTRISPLDDKNWIFSGPLTLMGRLGKPKLAVAIGNFKQNYPSHLYGDAPELLKEAWLSVEYYHQQFINFFEYDEITLTGRELEIKLSEFQEVLVNSRLASAGIDNSESLQKIIDESDIDRGEIIESAETIDVDAQKVTNLLDNQVTSKMVTPKIDLPQEILKAPKVTVISHPRWGQIFLTDYEKLKSNFENSDFQSNPGQEKIIKDYLKKPEVSAYIFFRLREKYSPQLEKVLQNVLQTPNFSLINDLNQVLEKYNKILSPELPEIASVPIHLNNLFEEALLEVNSKKQSKRKGKTKGKTGFKT